MKAHHWVSYTVIHGSVLGFQVVHLQIQLGLGIVSRDRESALHGVCVVSTTTIFTNSSNPLQPLLWSLEDPVHGVITEGESRGCTGEFQGSPRWYQASPRLHQLHLTLDTCKDRESLSENSHTYILFFSRMSIYTLSILLSINHLLKQQQEKPTSNPTPW
jgi:hypothetical protein